MEQLFGAPPPGQTTHAPTIKQLQEVTTTTTPIVLTTTTVISPSTSSITTPANVTSQ
uniref:Uncharacterized protein n=1 Tax=Romanomermis culicivorax TaxID=13658 RepID=A0A915KA65_ROMCU